MGEKFLSERNLKFLLYEVFDAESLTRYPYYEEHSRDIFDMAIATALKVARDLLRPNLQEMDKKPPQFMNGIARVHPAIKCFMKECGEGGWIGAFLPRELGGQQFPRIISYICRFIFSAANYSASVFPSMTAGAANLIASFGTEDMKKTYLPKMLAGEWQGTMALTEADAGSSLADITTQARVTEQGSYKIKGQKTFISSADPDAVENVVHMMLARIKGAAAGLKGISLFVVPKKRIESGDLVFNDVHLAGIYHKLGYRGSPLSQLSIGENDDCRGYLLGEPGKGLTYMFQMMNYGRIGTGLGATAIASAAYYTALEYTKARLQGRKLGCKDPGLPQIPIVEHPDVKRMLLFQRSIVEGSLSLLMQCCKYADLGIVLSGEEKEKNLLLLDILTPVAKSYPAEMGILSVSQGLQCLGGYGYSDEFPLEQYYRDARIHPIHEGTTGIQGLDLLGRKVIMKNGRAFKLYAEEVKKTIRAANGLPGLNSYAEKLSDSLELLKNVTAHLTSQTVNGVPELFLADATLYLEFFGIISIAWQWLVQAVALQRALVDNLREREKFFYLGKLYTFRYFFEYELPKITGLAKRLQNSDGLTVEMKPEFFSD